jgi:hypothetical protein
MIDRRTRRHSARGVVLGIFIGCVAAATVLGAATADQGAPTKGRIPVEAYGPNGQLDLNMVPDFIGTLDRNGDLVGYVNAHDIGIFNGEEPSDRLAVYGEDLTTVVGYMVDGRGFVAIGEDDNAVPLFRVWTSGE